MVKAFHDCRFQRDYLLLNARRAIFFILVSGIGYAHPAAGLLAIVELRDCVVEVVAGEAHGFIRRRFEVKWASLVEHQWLETACPSLILQVLNAFRSSIVSGHVGRSSPCKVGIVSPLSILRQLVKGLIPDHLLARLCLHGVGAHGVLLRGIDIGG